MSAVAGCLLCLWIVGLTRSGTAVAAIAVAGGCGILVAVVRVIADKSLTIRPGQVGLIAAAVPVLAFATPTAYGFVAGIVADKSGSASQTSRQAADHASLNVLSRTDYLGAGLGSHRASSLVLTLLGTVGVLGTLLFALAVLSTVRAAGRFGYLPVLGALIAELAAQAIAIPDLSFPWLWLSLGCCANATLRMRGASDGTMQASGPVHGRPPAPRKIGSQHAVSRH